MPIRGLTKAKTTNPYKNNGGSVVLGGNANLSSGPITNVPTIANIVGFGARPTYSVSNPVTNAQISQHASVPVTKSTYQTYSSGEYARMRAGYYLARTYTNALAGVANTVFNCPGSENPYRDAIHKPTRVRATTLTGLSWASPSGNNANGEPKQGVVYTFTESDQNQNLGGTIGTPNSFGPDDAANPTRALPGEFAMIQDGKTVSQKDYPARTNQYE